MPRYKHTAFLCESCGVFWSIYLFSSMSTPSRDHRYLKKILRNSDHAAMSHPKHQSTPLGLGLCLAPFPLCLNFNWLPVQKGDLIYSHICPLCQVLDLYPTASPPLLLFPIVTDGVLSSCLFGWNVTFNGRAYVLPMDVTLSGHILLVHAGVCRTQKQAKTKSVALVYFILGERLHCIWN